LAWRNTAQEETAPCEAHEITYEYYLSQAGPAHAGDDHVGLLQPSLPEQPLKKHWQVLMVLRSLIIQTHLLLSSKQPPVVSDPFTGFVRVNPAGSSIVPANDRTDPCHKKG